MGVSHFLSEPQNRTNNRSKPMNFRTIRFVWWDISRPVDFCSSVGFGSCSDVFTQKTLVDYDEEYPNKLLM